MNEHIEYFKRWQVTYLMWAYSNFDRIVAETVKKHKEEMKEEKRKILFSGIITHLAKSNTELEQLDVTYGVKDLTFVSGLQWKVGDILTFNR